MIATTTRDPYYGHLSGRTLQLLFLLVIVAGIFLGPILIDWFRSRAGRTSSRNNRRDRKHPLATRGDVRRVVGAEPKPRDSTSSMGVPRPHTGCERSRRHDPVEERRS